MIINLLVTNEHAASNVLYAPELEMPETPRVAEICYPAVRVNDYEDYFYILESELGKYEEYNNHQSLGSAYNLLGGKGEVEKRFADIYQKNMLLLDLVGMKEAGEILDWDVRKISTYRKRGVFPEPLLELAMGPVWSKEKIEEYRDSRGRE